MTFSNVSSTSQYARFTVPSNNRRIRNRLLLRHGRWSNTQNKYLTMMDSFSKYGARMLSFRSFHLVRVLLQVMPWRTKSTISSFQPTEPWKINIDLCNTMYYSNIIHSGLSCGLWNAPLVQSAMAGTHNEATCISQAKFILCPPQGECSHGMVHRSLATWTSVIL